MVTVNLHLQHQKNDVSEVSYTMILNNLFFYILKFRVSITELRLGKVILVHTTHAASDSQS